MFFNLLSMKYQIFLEDRTKGRQILNESPANMPLEELSVKIKVELSLPLCDNGWHRFLYRGKVYVPDEHVSAEPEIVWECTGKYHHCFRSSERVRLKHLYTVLGSAIVYKQDDKVFHNEHIVRCTLVGRI